MNVYGFIGSNSCASYAGTWNVPSAARAVTQAFLACPSDGSEGAPCRPRTFHVSEGRTKDARAALPAKEVGRSCGRREGKQPRYVTDGAASVYASDFARTGEAQRIKASGPRYGYPEEESHLAYQHRGVRGDAEAHKENILVASVHCLRKPGASHV